MGVNGILVGKYKIFFFSSEITTVVKPSYFTLFTFQVIDFLDVLTQVHKQEIMSSGDDMNDWLKVCQDIVITCKEDFV
jgi:hypothetical protein